MKPIKTALTALPTLAQTLSLASLFVPGDAHAQDLGTAARGRMHVTKSPACGCCDAWVALAREEGYDIEVSDTSDITIAKHEAGIPDDLWSCHTAVIDGYVIEGHVPFAAVEKLLSERPDIAGLAVPGMPVGSPGMGDDPGARFEVIAFGGVAEQEVFYQAGR